MLGSREFKIEIMFKNGTIKKLNFHFDNNHIEHVEQFKNILYVVNESYKNSDSASVRIPYNWDSNYIVVNVQDTSYFNIEGLMELEKELIQ